MKNRHQKTKRVALAIVATSFAGLAGAQDHAVIEHMHENMDAVVKIQQAVVAGSLDATREPAVWLLEQDVPADMPDDWEVHVDAIKSAAQQTLDAADIEAAARATSQLGLACGGCHVANEVGIEFDDASRPSEKNNATEHMRRHEWAADRMWEGLIAHSPRLFGRGGNMLFESPLRESALRGHDHDVEWQGNERRIHQLAANATVVTEPAKMGEIYAEFLANCAVCHQSLKDGPKP